MSNHIIVNAIFDILKKQGLETSETSEEWFKQQNDKTIDELNLLFFETKERQIEKELNYDSNCFRYAFDKMPSDNFETEETTIFITYGFDHFCYEVDVNIDCEAFSLHGRKVYFKINATEDKKYITYGDIFRQSDMQLKEYLTEIIKDKKWKIKYEDFLCNHVFMEILEKKTEIQYELYCGS